MLSTQTPGAQTNELLRVAVVGCGYWGPNLVRNFASTPGAEVACVCDLDSRRVGDMARRFRIERATTSFEDVLTDASIDAVVLATPVASHRPLGIAALEAGKHVWVEKPLAGNAEDASALVDAAHSRDRCLFVDHTFVYTPAVRKIRELISAGELGDVLYFDSVRVNLGLFQADTNVIWDLGPHDLSIAQHLLGRTPREVSAIGVRHFNGTHENMAYLTLRYDDNLIAHFHFNWLAPVKVRLSMIGGTRRMLVWDDLDQAAKIKIFDKGIDVQPQDLETRARTLVSYRSGDMWSPRIDLTEALVFATREFVSAVRESRAPATSGKDGLDVVRTLSAAQRSLDLGGAFVPVNP